MHTSAADFLEQIQDPMAIYDPATSRIVHANKRALDMAGCSLEEICRLHMEDFGRIDPDLTARRLSLDLLSKAISQNVRFPCIVRSRSGADTQVHVSLQAVQWEGERRVMAICRELPDMVETARVLGLLGADPGVVIGFGVVSPTGRITYASDAVATFLGLDAPERLFGMDIGELLHEADRGQEILQALQETGRWSGSLLAKTRDGGLLELNVVARRGECCLFGEGPNYLCTCSVATAGKVKSAHIGMDDSLAHLERLAEIGLLACGSMHDVNNYLSVILAHCDLLRGYRPDDREVLEQTQQVVHAARSAAQLQHQILHLAREKHPGANPISVNEVLRRNQPLLEIAATRMVEFVLDLCDQECVVRFDPVQLAEVLLNLVNNARDAMPLGGHLEIGLRPDENAAAVLMWIQDTGEGIPEELLEKVFEPFFSTKPIGHGTGLGLSMSRRIVEGHGGRITVSSEKGAGTRVEVLLPLVRLV